MLALIDVGCMHVSLHTSVASSTQRIRRQVANRKAHLCSRRHRCNLLGGLLLAAELAVRSHAIHSPTDANELHVAPWWLLLRPGSPDDSHSSLLPGSERRCFRKFAARTPRCTAPHMSLLSCMAHTV